MKLSKYVCAMVLMLACGCSSSPHEGRWHRGDYHLGYGLPFLDREALREPLHPADKGGDPASSLEDVSARIWILADNQRHELLGSSIMLWRMSARIPGVGRAPVSPVVSPKSRAARHCSRNRYTKAA